MPRWTLAEPQCYVRLPYSNPIAMCEILMPDAPIASSQYYLRICDVGAETSAIGGRRALLLRLVQDRVSFHHLLPDSTRITHAHDQYTPTRSRVVIKLAQYSSRKTSFMT